MSNQNRFLLPHSSTGSASSTSANPYQSASGRNTSDNITSSSASAAQHQLDQENQLSVDTDFDSYWEEEARNPNRNRIRIGRQYQATVPPLLKQGEKDQRKLEDLETLSFCPKRSAKVSNAELDHYFTVAKSLNLFASLVETRSLLGRDVTIADLNHIRHKEGLSLASVIQPSRQTSNVSPQSALQQQVNSSTPSNAVCSSQQAPPLDTGDSKPTSNSSTSPRQALSNQENYTLNQPLMKALSHFISLHHPCHHDEYCKKLLKDTPFEDEPVPTVSITSGNLRQGSSKEQKVGRSRSSLKQQQQQNVASCSPLKSSEELDRDTNSGDNIESDQQQANDAAQSSGVDDWTREEVELFSKAIEVCGKNFSSIKKEFLPSKSVKSIVEYYYIGSRDVSETKKKSTQPLETSDACSSPEKSTSANNNNQGGNGGNGGQNSGSNISSSSKSANHLETNSSNNHNTSSSRTSGSLNNNECTQNQQQQQSSPTDLYEATRHASLNQPESFNLAQSITSPTEPVKARGKNFLESSDDLTKSLKSKSVIDARMSIYNFDDEFKEESPTRFECQQRPGAEVKPLKAKPIIPNSSTELEAGNSNVGSLKFFMDGQLVLKLNACQEQQEGIEKCHWVQSSEKVVQPNTRQKRFTKRPNDRPSFDQSHNGSESNSVISSNHDEASKNDDSTADEDSKESANSFTTNPRPKSFSASPTPKRLKTKTDTANLAHQTSKQQQQQQQQQPQQQLNQPIAQQAQSGPIDYNRIALNNRMKERSDSLNQIPMVNQQVPMPWLQANSFAFAAALLGGLPFPTAPPSNLPPNQPQNISPNTPHPINITSKPMDLTLEHTASAPRPIQTKPSSRSRNSRPKNN